MGLTGKVVFSSGRAADFDIWCLDLKTGSLTQLTQGRHINDYPRWSPRGDLIAFTRLVEDSISSIWVMDPDGGNQRQVTSGIFCRAPSWHPDGQTLVFSGNAGDKNELNICSVAADGSDMKVLFERSGIESMPTVTPDGKSILFSAESSGDHGTALSGSADIMEYNIASGDIRTIHSHPLHDCDPSCSPDGEWIAFVSYRKGTDPEEYQNLMSAYREIICNGTNAEGRKAMQMMKGLQRDGDIYISDRNGTSLRQVTENSRADRAPCWSPCGNYIMYSTTDIDNPDTDRLCVINAHTCEPVPFSYDREPLEEEIGATQSLNRSLVQKLMPDTIERLLVDPSFWGAERHPSWKA
jgi:Tol biopolymer transport system component